ncbi:DUF563 domain-containing protein [Polynucleobacter sp. UK-Kesae-W10]|uniref:glycosyltransferase family 61 protein n=1 Tax=Polynucleobacter sp. UK-Kesae-W10 TaxID=1819738 RepID=UPI001C0D6B4B|nr:glycosyltransferase family 61 protein [Polynucleobacter sp. UK-Kesae-W10]MBU3578105.1 glycosyltransferase family 61 protein [Polynucleobacter sp. UK-Kesae-W10]
MYISQLPSIPLDELFKNYSTKLDLSYSSTFKGDITFGHLGSNGLDKFTNYTGPKYKLPNFVFKIPEGIFIGGAYNIFSLKDSVKFHHFCIDHAHNTNHDWLGYFEQHHNQMIPSDLLRFKGRTLLLKGTWSEAFYHFITETLAKIFVAQKEFDLNSFDQIIVSSPHMSYVKQWLQLLGINSTKIIDVPAHQAVISDELYVPTYLQMCGFTSLELIEWLNTRVPESAIINPALEGAQKIYISRSGSRRLLNEAELKKPLIEAGYKIVQLEKLPILDQILLLKNARSVIAPHGAGLSNLVFSHGKILELVGKGYNNTCFADISLHTKSDYQYLVCDESQSNIIAPEPIFKDYLLNE